MKLSELFKPDGPMIEQLRNQVMDHLTPLVARGVEFVTVQDIQDTLTDNRTGLFIDRPLIMQILDPNVVKIIKKIQGDRIYLTGGTVSPDTMKTKSDEEKDKDDIRQKASKQAKKSVETKI